MSKRLTPAQRRERDHWLGCAERADASARGETGEAVFLCCEAQKLSAEHVLRVQDLFDVDPQKYGRSVKWASGVSDKYWESCEPLQEAYDRPSNRVLAACFLAAMAELGE